MLNQDLIKDSLEQKAKVKKPNPPQGMSPKKKSSKLSLKDIDFLHIKKEGFLEGIKDAAGEEATFYLMDMQPEDDREAYLDLLNEVGDENLMIRVYGDRSFDARWRKEFVEKMSKETTMDKHIAHHIFMNSHFCRPHKTASAGCPPIFEYGPTIDNPDIRCDIHYMIMNAHEGKDTSMEFCFGSARHNRLAFDACAVAERLKQCEYFLGPDFWLDIQGNGDAFLVFEPVLSKTQSHGLTITTTKEVRFEVTDLRNNSLQDLRGKIAKVFNLGKDCAEREKVREILRENIQQEFSRKK